MSAEKTKATIYVLIGLILALLVAIMVFSVSVVNGLKSNLSIQVHTTKVLLALNDNLVTLLNAETGERGYLITGDTNFLEPYKLALRNFPGDSSTLRTLTKDNPVQQRNLDTLEYLITRKFIRISKLIALKKNSNEYSVQKVLASSNEGRQIMDSIRVINESMKAEELKLSVSRASNTNSSITASQTFLLCEGFFSLVITSLLGFTIIRELHRRTRAEKELLISTERFFKIFDESPIAMSLSEIGTNKILFANNLFYKSFGYSKDEVIGHTSQELHLTSQEEEARLVVILLDFLNETRPVSELQKLSKDENEKLIIKLKQAMGNKGLEVLYTRKNGENFYALLSYDLIEIDNKKFTITSYQDVSEQKEAENKISAYSMELERKNKELEQFAYIASHDLQEPLRSITNFSALLAEKLEVHPDSGAKEYVGFINKGAKRMSGLIFDLLEYSRLGKDLQKLPVDTNVLVEEVLSAMSSIITESGAEIHTGKLPILNGNVYLKSLFQNLISNAIKFRKKDAHPVVTISAVDKGREYLFSIADNGIGIEKEYYDRIFIIFQRLHTRTEYEGTGIGLSQCKKIVELYGGKMWVESEPGKGSTFYFTISKK